MSLLTNFLIAISVLLVTFIYWLNRRQDYFKNVKVPYIPSLPLIGVFKDALFRKIAFYDQIAVLYNQPEVKDKPFFGMFVFHKPTVMINEPELIKKVLVKDFASFANRYSGSDVHDPLGNYNLFSIKAPLWKTIRGKLSPFFSSGKLKTMYYLLDKVGDNLIKHINKRLDSEGKVEMEMKELASLFATDVISTCAYGVEANCLENPDAEFRKAGSAMFEATLKRSFEFPVFFLLPQLMKLFNFTFFSSKLTKFIQEAIPMVMTEREKHGNKRNDLIDTLLEIKKAAKEDGNTDITMDILVAQAAVFFSAGFETSSATQSFALYHIAMDPDIQERVRDEIRDMLVRNDGKVTYDSVMNISELPFLNQIVSETLRMYAILPILDRACINPEGVSLEPYSDFKIPNGMPVFVPIFAIQRDEKYFPDPLKFDPERFAPENAHKIQPCTFFPFGVGPRNCVGERFGLMQVKTGLVKTLMNFRLETTAKTPEVITLEKSAMVVQSEHGLFLNLVKDPLY